MYSGRAHSTLPQGGHSQNLIQRLHQAWNLQSWRGYPLLGILVLLGARWAQEQYIRYTVDWNRVTKKPNIKPMSQNRTNITHQGNGRTGSVQRSQLHRIHSPHPSAARPPGRWRVCCSFCPWFCSPGNSLLTIVFHGLLETDWDDAPSEWRMTL